MNTKTLLSATGSDEVLKRCCIGVHPADILPEDLPPGKGIIINTDISSEPGTHWTAMFRSLDGVIHFHDSYGNHPDQYHPSWTEYMLKFNDKSDYNMRRVQSSDSVACGCHCLLFLLCCGLGIDFEDFVSTVYTDDFDFNDAFAEMFVETYVNMDLIPGDPPYMQSAKCLNSR
jgi:hypothetical protein